jgi:hypothetical protein
VKGCFLVDFAPLGRETFSRVAFEMAKAYMRVVGKTPENFSIKHVNRAERMETGVGKQDENILIRVRDKTDIS